jgi:TRAP-type C4-dicarboxylate transport system permease small subunit
MEKEALMKSHTILILILFTFFASAAWPQAQPQWKHKIITYEVPGAGNGAGQDTQAFGINSSGEVAGFYTDANNVYHGFLRSPKAQP